MEKEQEFLKIQNSLKEKISLKDSFDKNNIKNVAGVDLAYWQDENGKEQAVCCIVVIDYISHEIVEKKQYSGSITVPYLSGFLAFRELPLVLETAKLLESDIDVFIFDGNGYLHPRHMGLATHASFYLNKPTFGIAKSYYRVDRKTDYIEPEQQAGAYTDIVINGEVYGRALRTLQGVKPVFVSVGNNISLNTACEMATALTDKQSHIPIPTRFADLQTHIARAEIQKL